MSVDTRSLPRSRTSLSALAVYCDRRVLVMLALGFSSGLPLLLIFDTLSAWLRAAGLSLQVIGFFSMVTMIYSFKFLWAPLVDRTRVPILTAWLGHRRSWMLVCQGLIMLGLWLVAGTDPARNLLPVAIFAVLVGFSSATQDIAVDAWRIEAAEVSKQGAMAAAYQWGYRVATITAGAVPLLLAGVYGWNFSYAVMAALMAVGIVGVLAAPPEAEHVIRAIHTDDIPRAPLLEPLEWIARVAVFVAGALLLGSGLTANASALTAVLTTMGAGGAGEAVRAAWSSSAGVFIQFAAVLVGLGVIGLSAVPIPGVLTRPGRFLSVALGDPIREFFTRHGSAAWLIFALVCVYRIPDFVLNIMNPFYIDLGFSLVEIAEVRKVFGVVMLVVGVFAGGFAVARWGVMRALLLGAFAGAASNLLFAWLAMRGHSIFALFVAIGLDNVASGFAGTCLIAYMSGLTSAGFTATQYALLSSLYAIPGRIIASQSGRIVEAAAKSAEAGGAFAGLKGLFSGLPPESFAGAIQRSGVAPASLGSGYVTFFGYSALIGLLPIVLAIVVQRLDRHAPGTPASE